MAENCKRDDQTRIACAKFGHFFVVRYSRDVTREPRDENGQWTDSGGSAIGNLAKTATERGWSVKVMAKKAIEAGIDPVKLRNAAAEIVKSGKAKRPNFRSHNGRGKVIDDGSGLSDDEINENFSSADDLLKKHGGVMDDESDSGSRYYSIPNGRKVRVADHEPNEATSQWIERNDVHQIRTDKRTFKSALQQVIEAMRESVRYSRDVSGEARDEDGRWTDSGGGSGEKKTKLYRAADYAEVRVGYSLSDQRETAEAYLDNPGFGGKSLHRIDVNLNHVLDLSDSDDLWRDLSEASGIDIDPENHQYHFQRVLPTRDDICEALAENGYHWVKFQDDFPEGATTLIPVSQEAADEADESIREIKKRI